MIDRVAWLWPEIALFIATCLVMLLGLSPNLHIRRLCAFVCFFALFIAAILAINTTPAGSAIDPRAAQVLLPNLVLYAKVAIAAVGMMLILLMAGTVDRDEEALIAAGRPFQPLRTNRAEFYSFFLFSLTGLMLCASADDLIWLFLALELTSLPTYIMVTISGRGRRAAQRSQEAGVKYFFLGAMGAAVFLFGFALLYGGTGTTNLNEIHASLAHFGVNDIALAGLLMSVLGLCFKIAAVPMHFYTPDVYQGAAAPVAAFLAFVPKTAGFLAIMLITAAVGWRFGPAEHGIEVTGNSLPETLRVTLWVVAALTMTVGNVLAILQNNLKRILAYSSIAHSGYMLVGIVAGPGSGEGSITSNGLAAVLFYLLAYGVMNLGTFAVIACLERRDPATGEVREVEGIEDLRGLCSTRPLLGWVMVVCSLSLLGLPPLLGFFGKLPLFTSAVGAGEVLLVVVLGLNSAIAAFYYLRLAGAPMLEPATADAASIRANPHPSRVVAGLLSAAGVILLAIAGEALMTASGRAGTYLGSTGGAPLATGEPENHSR